MARGTTRRKRRTYSDAERRQILKQLAASGLGVAVFARKTGIHFTSLYAWRRRFRTPARQRTQRAAPRRSRTVASSVFAPVHLVTDAGTTARGMVGSQLELTHRDGFTLRVPADIDPAGLARLVHALATQATDAERDRRSRC